MRDLQERLNECLGKAFNVTTEGVEGCWMRISTPFWDDHGDQIQIFATEEGSGIRLSDDNFLCEEGRLSGLEDADIRKMAEPILKRVNFGALGEVAKTGKESGLDVIIPVGLLSHRVWDYLHLILEMLVILRQARGDAGNAD